MEQWEYKDWKKLKSKDWNTQLCSPKGWPVTLENYSVATYSMAKLLETTIICLTLYSVHHLASVIIPCPLEATRVLKSHSQTTFSATTNKVEMRPGNDTIGVWTLGHRQSHKLLCTMHLTKLLYSCNKK